jgi:Ran GTPase-activating protein (RanGAP) involved in mRNA processing and transport
MKSAAEVAETGRDSQSETKYFLITNCKGAIHAISFKKFDISSGVLRLLNRKLENDSNSLSSIRPTVSQLVRAVDQQTMYEDVQDNEYLDVSKNNLGLKGVLDILKDISEDTLLKQVDLSRNMVAEEFFNPKNIENFYKKLKYYLAKNNTLTALDLSGNYLFYYHPHPTNEHVKNYEKELANALLATKVKRVDLSDNNIAGYTGRELDGMVYFLKTYMVKGQALQVRNSHLSCQGFHALTHCLGVYSSLTYLDVSDNLGGLDAAGRHSSEGIVHFAKILSQTIHLRTLKIARNQLIDQDIDSIAEAVHDCVEFRDLDISGNLGRYYSCRSLKQAVISHCIFCSPAIQGFRELNISTNLIGDDGIKEICIAIRRSETLEILRIANCGLTEVGGQWLQDALAENSTIVVIDAFGNLMSEEQEILVVVCDFLFFLFFLFLLVCLTLLFFFFFFVRRKLKRTNIWKRLGSRR